MKKRNLFFVCLLCVVFGCNNERTSIQYIEDPSLSKVLVKRALVIGVDDYTPILSFRDINYKITGYDVDIFKAVCRKMNIRPIFYPIEWAKKEELLNNGNIDCIISGFSITEERKQHYLFTTPYLQNVQVLVSLTRNHYTGLTDLANKRIGIQEGSLSRDVLEKIPELASSEIVEYPYSQTLYEVLNTGLVAGIVVDLIPLYDKLLQQDTYTVIGEPLSSEFFAFAFRKTDKTLAKKIESVLKELDREGVIPVLSQKYFNANLSVLNIGF